MVIKLKTSYFEVLKNTRQALNLEQLATCYIEEFYDNFPYIVGDICDSKLRLKQFSYDRNSKDYFHKIPDYLLESCCYKPAYFILHRISEDEYLKREKEAEDEVITSGDTICEKLEKVPFDKENLVLTKSEKEAPNIKLDMNRLTSVKAFSLPLDIQKEVLKEKMLEQKNRLKNSKNQNRNRNNNNNNNNRNKKDKTR